MKFRKMTKTELIWLLLSVIAMGFCLSFLERAALGIDPCTMFNLGMANLLHISLGNWQAIYNSMLFIIVFIFGKDQIGWGTLANMFLVGYSFDFFSWLNELLLPDTFYSHMVSRILIAFPILALFILAASIYIAVQQGTAPYDAIPFIIHKKLNKVSFKVVRICWDVLAFILGLSLGSKAGIVTVIIAFAFGPMITYTQKNIISKLIKKS